ncbi:Chromatin modification-related protein meaf6 [Rhodotorula kratochvilovae]
MATDPQPAASTSTAAPPAPAPAPPPTGTTPHPLDGLSPTDLRIKLEHARKSLRAHLDKKRKIDRDLAVLEQSIYNFEGSYLSDGLFPASATANSSSASAAQFGNIIRGYDSYLKAPAGGGGDRRKVGRPGEGPNDKERMFSASSATYQRSIDLRTAEAAASVEPESDDDASSRKKRRH